MDPFNTYYLLDASQYDDDDTRNARGSRDHRERSQPGLIRNPYGLGRARPPVRVVPAPAPMVVAPGSQPSGVLGNLDKAELAALLGQAVAALMPLPAGPTGTGDVTRDVSNQTLYLTALALHVKRAEQLRLLGDAIAAFLD
jgi:hypothetical protein